MTDHAAPPPDSDADAAESGPLQGELLVAMPSMGDPRFQQSVIFMCSHGSEGAMGLIVNKRAHELTFPELLRQVGVPAGEGAEDVRVHFGGPVEIGRGFVLHSNDWEAPGATKPLPGGMALTATLDILREMSAGRGPSRAVLTLGYAGWAPGQLEQELQANGWLICPGDADLVFSEDDDAKWRLALDAIGVDPAKLSAQGGLA